MQTTTRTPTLRGPVALIHLLLQRFVSPGDHTIDATCGNGKDTLVLAQLVGTSGHVTAFDIQSEALQRTAQRLREADLSAQTSLLCCGHELMEQHVAPPVSAVVFNLGWLPGADRTIVTRPETTLQALNSACRLLKSGGIVLITCYPGHSGGDQETEEILSWSAALAPARYHVWRMSQPNTSADAPFCLLIQKTDPPCRSN